MSTSLEQIRAALDSYLFDKSGKVDLPENIVELLEDADGDAKYKAETMEALLALHAGNKISQASLRERLREVVLTQPFVTTEKMVLAASGDNSSVTEIATGTTLTTPRKADPWVLERLRVETTPAWEPARAK